MEMYSLLLVIPPKLAGIGKELEVTQKYNNKDLMLSVKECNSVEVMLDEYISKGNIPDFILLFENINNFRMNKDEARTTMIEALKEVKFNHNSKIIVLIEEEQENTLLPFVNELIKISINDFYFINEFTKVDILNWLFSEPKTLKDNLKYIITEIKAKEIIKEVEVPVYIGAAEEQKTVQTPIQSSKKSIKTNYIIGVIGTSPGTGATSLCVNYAAHLNAQDKKILLLDRTENKHLANIEIKGQEIKSCLLSDIEKMQSYDYIIIDFGTLATITPDNKILPKPDLTNEKKLERQFCNKIILVGSSLPWKISELELYIEQPIFSSLTEEWLFYINGEKNNAFDNFEREYKSMRDFIVAYKESKPILEIERNIR